MVEIFAFEEDPTDFQVTWPHDTEDSVLVDVVEVSPQEAPVFTQADNGDLRFEMPALELTDDDVDADEVPDEVAAAVRRAIAAIEMVSGEVPVIPPIDVDTDLFGIETTSETTPSRRVGIVEFRRVRSADAGHERRGDVRPAGNGCRDTSRPGFR